MGFCVVLRWIQLNLPFRNSFLYKDQTTKRNRFCYSPSANTGSKADKKKGAAENYQFFGKEKCKQQATWQKRQRSIQARNEKNYLRMVTIIEDSER